ncbi:MAG: ATP-binding protein [Paludibacteraceae bacterium]
MRTIILSQREERDRLASLPYLTRQTSAVNQDLLHSPFIKLITGPRRAGKSVFALLMVRYENYAYLNFDDKNLLDKWDEDLVMATLSEVYPNYQYLLLDEVQNLPHWDLWVSKLYRNGYNMIITGSNANMLSGEMATVLTGRYLPLQILPFSLSEIMAYHHIDLQHIPDEKQAEVSAITDDYLHNGGFPETMPSRQLTRNYLATLYDSIIWKDIVQRHRIRNTTDLYNLAGYLLSNFCNPFTANEVTKELGMSSVATTQRFCAYLAEPFLFFYLPRYNNKLKLMQKAPQKIYVVDNGFVQSSAFRLSENLGRLLENQVFVELLRRGYNCEKTLFYYRSRNDKEVDFVTRQGAQVEQLIQVCYDMSSPKTTKREIDALLECAQELKCTNLTIVTATEERTIEQDGYTIRVLPVTKF